MSPVFFHVSRVSLSGVSPCLLLSAIVAECVCGRLLEDSGVVACLLLSPIVAECLWLSPLGFPVSCCFP